MKELGEIFKSKSSGMRDQSKAKGKSSREASEYSNNAGNSWLKTLGVGALLATGAMISGGVDAARASCSEGVVLYPFSNQCRNNDWQKLQHDYSQSEVSERLSMGQQGVEREEVQCSNLASSHQEVAEVIVKHPEMMKKALEVILKKPEMAKDLLETILKSPQMTKEILETILKEPEMAKDLLETILKKSETTKDLLETILKKPEMAKDLLETILKSPQMTKEALEIIVDNTKNLKKMWKIQNSEFEKSRAKEIKEALNDLGALLGIMNGLYRKKNCFGQVSTEECIKDTGRYPFIEKNCYETDYTKGETYTMEQCIKDHKRYPSSTTRVMETETVQPSNIITTSTEIQETQTKEVQLSDSVSLYQEFTKALLKHPERIKEALGIILKSPEMTKEAVEIILDNPNNVRQMHTIQSSNFEKVRAIDIKRAIIELKSQLKMMTSEFVDKNCCEGDYTEECKKVTKRYNQQ